MRNWNLKAILGGLRNASRVALHAPGGRKTEGKKQGMNVMEMFCVFRCISHLPEKMYFYHIHQYIYI